MFKITIGIPVYNEIKYIKDTLQSIENQSSVIDGITKVIICDNASTDGSSIICENFAKKHPNIYYIRHRETIGAHQNFLYSLRSSETKYFMWLGGHDILPKDYLQTMLDVFEENPDASLVYCPVKYIDSANKFISFYKYPEQFSKELFSRDPFIRIVSLVENMTDFTLLHSLFKTKILKYAMYTYSQERNRDISHLSEMIPSSERLVFSRAASSGPFAYASSTEYIRREFRQGQKPLDAFTRAIRAVTGSDDVSIPEWKHRYRQVQGGILQVIQDIPGSYIVKQFWLIHVKKVLAKRFGVYYTNI